MGSGRGRARRASTQTATDTNTHVITDESLWHDFVSNAGVEKTRMISYYGIDNTNPEKLKVSPNAVAELRLATEVFRDLVSMGAITLPPGISADDYELRINAKQYPIQVELSKKSNPKQQKHVISHPHRMLSERVTFGSNEALLLIRNLLKVSEEL